MERWLKVESKDRDKLPFRDIGIVDVVPFIINFKPGETKIFESEESLNFGNTETEQIIADMS